MKLRDDRKKEKSCETLPFRNILVSGKTLRRERVDSISVDLSAKGGLMTTEKGKGRGRGRELKGCKRWRRTKKREMRERARGRGSGGDLAKRGEGERKRVGFCLQIPNFLTFKEPKYRFQGTKSARLCSLAGRDDSPFPTRFLAPHRLFKNSSTGEEREKSEINEKQQAFVLNVLLHFMAPPSINNRCSKYPYTFLLVYTERQQRADSVDSNL